ncbi:hypothetical protein FHG87_016905 [Trinorchestia longiramus]|nr:hypothetical protein FHG87_016905 [Trinorchestia longiramus]
MLPGLQSKRTYHHQQGRSCYEAQRPRRGASVADVGAFAVISCQPLAASQLLEVDPHCFAQVLRIFIFKIKGYCYHLLLVYPASLNLASTRPSITVTSRFC